MSDTQSLWQLRDRILTLDQRLLVLGIVNVTPDSFSDGGRFFSPQDAVAHGLRLIEEGADMLDIGGESSRPGATPVAAASQIEWVARWFERYNTLPAAQNPSGPATIEEEFEYARAFTERTHLPTYLGEFGVGDGAIPASRVSWTRSRSMCTV